MSNPHDTLADELRELLQDWEGQPITEETAPRLLNELHGLLPAQTMAEIEWDDEEHFLAEATYEGDDGDHYAVIMLQKHGGGGIRCLEGHRVVMANAGDLIPTGRRWALCDVAELEARFEARQDVQKELAETKEQLQAEKNKQRGQLYTPGHANGMPAGTVVEDMRGVLCRKILPAWEEGRVWARIGTPDTTASSSLEYPLTILRHGQDTTQDDEN